MNWRESRAVRLSGVVCFPLMRKFALALSALALASFVGAAEEKIPLTPVK